MSEAVILSNGLKCFFFQIFSSDEELKIEAHACGYKRSFSKIDVLSVYKDVLSLDSKKFSQWHKLKILVRKARESAGEGRGGQPLQR